MDLDAIIQNLPHRREAILELREIVLANAVMFGEIPSPTFGEEKRARFLMDRFNECGCQSICTDEAGNAISLFPGKVGDRSILLSAHLDTPFTAAVDHTVTVHGDYLEGPGILDNSLGVAVIASLPSILERIGIELNSNLILMGSTKSLGQGDIQGMRFFLDNHKMPIDTSVIVEGGTLGRLSYTSLGVRRMVLDVRIPKDFDVLRHGSGGALPVFNKVLSRILSIPTPTSPPTRIILGSVSGGNSFNTPANRAQIKLEVRSEDPNEVQRVYDEISDIAEEITYSSGARVSIDPVASRDVGGLPYGHPLVASARAIMAALDVTPRIAPSTGELAALVGKGIPAVTLGITSGSDRHDFTESASIDNIWTGFTQLIGLLLAIDGGLCDAES